MSGTGGAEAESSLSEDVVVQGSIEKKKLSNWMFDVVMCDGKNPYEMKWSSEVRFYFVEVLVVDHNKIVKPKHKIIKTILKWKYEEYPEWNIGSLN